MKLDEAKELLLEEGFRIIEDFEEEGDIYSEVPVDNQIDIADEEGGELDSDVFGAIEQGLGDEGFDPTETADIMTNYAEKINELIEKGVETDDIVKILAYENCPECDDEEPVDDEIPAEGEDFDDVPVDEAYMTEGKSKPKSDKFTHKQKVACKKQKGCCGKDCDDDDDDLDEALEDIPGVTREPRGQEGTDDWSDFKDDFRAKTLLLKAALTPKFVSNVIKDSDFEADDKMIKEYAFKVVEEVFGTKDAVRNLQIRIRRKFVG